MMLIFVYNANSGHFNALLDSAHKMLSPSTYDCKLCDLTYGTFREKEEWERFRESVDIPLTFLHKDEFLKAYKSKWLPKYTFPAVLLEAEGALEMVISSTTFDVLNSIEELIGEVKRILGNE